MKLGWNKKGRVWGLSKFLGRDRGRHLLPEKTALLESFQGEPIIDESLSALGTVGSALIWVVYTIQLRIG